MNKTLKVKCPHCDLEFLYYESKFRPFCCERCKMVDMGHWFEESYRVPVKGGDSNNFDEENNENGEHEEEIE